MKTIMKTRLRDLLKNNKLLNIVSNRYNLDKEDRKTLNEMISNQGGGIDDGMEYYKIVDKQIMNVIIDTSISFVSYILKIDNENKILKNDQVIFMQDEPNIIGFSTSDKIQIDVESTLTLKENLEEDLNFSSTSLSDTTVFKRITAKEYYALAE